MHMQNMLVKHKSRASGQQLVGASIASGNETQAVPRGKQLVGASIRSGHATHRGMNLKPATGASKHALLAYSGQFRGLRHRHFRGTFGAHPRGARVNPALLSCLSSPFGTLFIFGGCGRIFQPNNRCHARHARVTIAPSVVVHAACRSPPID
jgi:hypothetical protein